MLTETTKVDLIEVIETGHVQVRQARIISDESGEISRTFHRYVLEPNADLTGQDPKVIAIAQAAWG